MCGGPHHACLVRVPFDGKKGKERKKSRGAVYFITVFVVINVVPYLNTPCKFIKVESSRQSCDLKHGLLSSYHGDIVVKNLSIEEGFSPSPSLFSPQTPQPRSSNMFLRRAIGRTLFAATRSYSSAAPAAASSTSRATYNPLEQFFETDRNAEDDKPVVY
ncbi:hypothetical protein AKJ16_DCAP13144, partial [Drosera capensis]